MNQVTNVSIIQNNCHHSIQLFAKLIVCSINAIRQIQEAGSLFDISTNRNNVLPKKKQLQKKWQPMLPFFLSSAFRFRAELNVMIY